MKRNRFKMPKNQIPSKKLVGLKKEGEKSSFN